MSLPSLKIQNIDEVVEDRLEFLIISGVFRPDQPIPSERALAQELGVSRTAVRLALSRLRAKRLIQKTKSGHKVSVALSENLMAALSTTMARHPRDMMNLWWFLILESHRVARQKATGIDQQRISNAIRQLADAFETKRSKGQCAALSELSMRLAEASYNFCFIQSMHIILRVAEPAFVSVLRSFDGKQRLLWLKRLSELQLTSDIYAEVPTGLEELDFPTETPSQIETGGLKGAGLETNGATSRLVEFLSMEQFRIGDHVPPVNDLANRLSYSEDAIQLALLELVALDMLQHESRNKYIILQSEPASPIAKLIESILRQSYAVETVFEFRISVESAIAAAAARNINETQIAEFENLLSDMSELAGKDSDAYSVLDAKFHERLAQVSRQPALSALSGAFQPIITHVIQHWLSKHSHKIGDNLRIHMQHVELFKAVKTHNPNAAARQMQDHLAYVLKSLARFEHENHLLGIAQLRESVQ
ncbi:pyruvate dehydrogenase complex repressor (plasmid) [Maritalea myrionectae]|uniref:Pyruvate dehydrogenase complex repressor n=1 Tax=Maritalea myrionectae TaxID=454601 RepID=A0A2R4MJA5_9HYPH|nr:FCD domain-containing protein [Maritalea myrionectae]AVX06067.1 pyruvate dehydrogenase complex repressor [Maritalea myrionectae]